jgi:hypothetical protein
MTMKYLHQTLQHQLAPELYGDYWFNSEPLSIRQLEGRPAVLFFWDCTSLQSKKFIPFINGLHALYLEFGLVCIGVHTSEFEFAQDASRIEQEIRKSLILFPVLTDNSRNITNAYRISTFPSICLINNKGNIYDTLSETIIPERIERSLQYLLRQSGYYGELPMLLNPELEENYDLPEGKIDELHCGYAHGALGNPEGYSPELAAQYVDPKVYLEKKIYTDGIWRAERNGLIYEGKANQGYITCRCYEDDIHVLVGSTAKSIVKVNIDGAPIMLSFMGHDVKKNKQGGTFFRIDTPKIISIVQKSKDKNGVLTLIPQSSGISFYMFSFVAGKSEYHASGESFIRNN